MADHQNSGDSPESVAQAVYHALLNGTRLPPLNNNSEELRQALLHFDPSSVLPSHKRRDKNGNKSFEIKSKERVEDIGIGLQADLAGNADVLCNEEEKGYGKMAPISTSAKSRMCPSVLMLEALSRRRLDAVCQLHEACPELLSSIPLFDDVLSPANHDTSSFPYSNTFHSVSSNGNSSMSYPHTGPVVSNSAHASSSDDVVGKVCCHLRKAFSSSRLLDLAAESRELLVFVLQHHPRINMQQQHQHRCKYSDEDECTHCQCQNNHSQLNNHWGAYDIIPSAHNSHQSPMDAASSSWVTDPGSQTASTQEKKDKNEGMSEGPRNTENKSRKAEENVDLLLEFDPSSLIAICLQNNNVEVLQYLLFKHVWQHYLLEDERFYLSRSNGHVHDGDASIHTCPACCPWFLHCAAFIGCPPLLQLLLSGQLCRHYHLSSPAVFNHLQARDATETDKLDSNVAVCPYEVKDVAREATVELNSKQNMTTAFQANKLDNCVGITPSQGMDDFAGKGICGCKLEQYVEKENVLKAVKLDINERDTTITAVEEGSEMKDNATLSFLPCQLQACALHLPDPNTLFPVSLPLMDRWISRCMQVKIAPLHLACWRCDPLSIQTLLSHGADVRILAEELPTFPESTPTPNSQNPETPSIVHSSETASCQPSEVDMAGCANSSAHEQGMNLELVTDSSSLAETTPHGSKQGDMSVSSEADIQRESKRDNQRELKGDKLSKGDKQGELATTPKPDNQTESSMIDNKNRKGLSPLAMLALGIRSPPDYSLFRGKSLGLVLPTLPELRGGQVDRGSWRTKQCVMDCLRLLLEAGGDVNADSIVFGKSYRVLDLFIQPPAYLYYAPLMPHAGKDSTTLRCLDLERVADIVLDACWELLCLGARSVCDFLMCLEWNLSRMDWMFIKDERLQRKFLHLAVFLGLFPPLDPALCGVSSHRQVMLHSPLFDNDSQISVDPSTSQTNLGDEHPKCDGETQAFNSMTSTETFSNAATITTSTADGAPSTNAPQMGRESNLLELEERQQNCLESFVNDLLRLSLSQTNLALILHFLCHGDLVFLREIVRHKLEHSFSEYGETTENPLVMIDDAVCEALHVSRLLHSCKLVILMAVRFRPSGVCSLPLPDGLRRYLLGAN